MQRTLATGSGDCDDKVTALCSLLASAGFVTRFVAGGMSETVMDHVWCEVFLDWRGEWLPLDPTNERADPGWFQPFPWRLEWEIFV